MIKFYIFLLTLFLIQLNTAHLLSGDIWYKYNGNKGYKIGLSINEVIVTPKGYNRIKVYKNSFSEWIRYIPIKKNNTVILDYQGNYIQDNFYSVLQVINLPLYFNQDLEQCADWAYRFWYEYQKEVGYGEDLWLTDYNGRKIKYREWKKKKQKPSLNSFFKWACSYANSYSQKVGLYKIVEKDLRPGDLIVQNTTGGIGHTSIIFDICANGNGDKLYLIGFSFMPAQECHIEKALEGYGKEGWFTLGGYYKFLEENLDYGKPVLRSFLNRDTLNLSKNPIENWIKYEHAVRDSAISIETAYLQLPSIMEGLREYSKNWDFNSAKSWSMPVEGYDISHFGGVKGNGYKPDIPYGVSSIKGYSFFDGNRHGGHPAHDIFIYDKNQDSLDDRTSQPVYVLAMLDGIVISVFESWENGSKLRGGNYIWCYHPQEDTVSYYAHLDKIIVKVGQYIKAGERLATIGRSGLLAAEKRCPTHLHLMCLCYDGKGLIPKNYYSKVAH
ncbi:MAG: DUF4846 domain-containing protein [bacterium]